MQLLIGLKKSVDEGLIQDLKEIRLSFISTGKETSAKFTLIHRESPFRGVDTE